LKTRRDGYDGKGQWRIKSEGDLAGLNLPAQALIYEDSSLSSANFP
jgi:5-(carboxyamino)imidazole ribonucleotide synthase